MLCHVKEAVQIFFPHSPGNFFAAEKKYQPRSEKKKNGGSRISAGKKKEGEKKHTEKIGAD